MRKELKVSGSSNPNKVAGAILHTLEAGEDVAVISIGPIALNGAVKGIIIAFRIAEGNGMRLTVVTSFVTLDTERGTATAIKHEISRKT